MAFLPVCDRGLVRLDLHEQRLELLDPFLEFGDAVRSGLGLTLGLVRDLRVLVLPGPQFLAGQVDLLDQRLQHRDAFGLLLDARLQLGLTFRGGTAHLAQFLLAIGEARLERFEHDDLLAQLLGLGSGLFGDDLDLVAHGTQFGFATGDEGFERLEFFDARLEVQDLLVRGQLLVRDARLGIRQLTLQRLQFGDAGAQLVGGRTQFVHGVLGGLQLVRQRRQRLDLLLELDLGRLERADLGRELLLEADLLVEQQLLLARQSLACLEQCFTDLLELLGARRRRLGEVVALGGQVLEDGRLATGLLLCSPELALGPTQGLGQRLDGLLTVVHLGLHDALDLLGFLHLGGERVDLLLHPVEARLDAPHLDVVLVEGCDRCLAVALGHAELAVPQFLLDPTLGLVLFGGQDDPTDEADEAAAEQEKDDLKTRKHGPIPSGGAPDSRSPTRSVAGLKGPQNRLILAKWTHRFLASNRRCLASFADEYPCIAASNPVQRRFSTGFPPRLAPSTSLTGSCALGCRVVLLRGAPPVHWWICPSGSAIPLQCLPKRSAARTQCRPIP